MLTPKQDKDTPYILVVQCENDSAEKQAIARIKESVRKYTVKSKTVGKRGVELTIEVRINEESTEFINDLTAIEGVDHAALVSYNGEYMS